MASAESDYKEWADALESARKLNSEWVKAKFPAKAPLVYLVTDGLFSTSFHNEKLSGSHWSWQVEKSASEAKCPGVVCAVSYSQHGSHYLPEHTAQEISRLKRTWRSYLDKIGPSQRVIPICFSLGAALALLTLQEWIQSVANPEQIIPAIILVAPAVSPSEHLLDGYQAKLRVGELPRGVPPVIRDFCNPSDPIRQAPLNALREIATNTKIKIHVLFWEEDQVTEYAKIGYPLIERPLTIENLRRNPVRAHIRVRDHAETEKSLMEILNNLEI